MTTMAEDNDVDFEEGMLWLPAHVLEEACEPKEQEMLQRRLQQQQQQQHRLTTLYSSASPFPPHSSSKLSPKLQQRARYPVSYRASGGPGMQAIFLDSGSQRSFGTGVFLPRMGGINFQPSKKPACSPVLLPSRVVQALNLNVHELGSQLTSQRDVKNDTNKKGGIRDSVVSNKNGSSNDVNVHGVSTTQCCVYSQACSCSPEIFLPKEWSY